MPLLSRPSAATNQMTDPVTANRRRSALVVLAFVATTIGIGTLIGWLAGILLIGIIVSALVAVGLVAFAYTRADALVLSVSRAVPADPQRYRRFHNLADGLCIANGLAKPRLYVIEDPAPNAMAVGLDPRNGSIALTTGLLESMNRVELEGVVAHQLARIRSHETAVGTLSVVVVGALPLLAELALRRRWWNGGRVPREGDQPERPNVVAALGPVLALSGPVVARLMRLAVGARRETFADLAACQITRYPPGLLAALEKMKSDCTVTHSATAATAHLWMAEPLAGVGDAGRLGRFHSPFSTHPPIGDRIDILREL